MSNAENFGRPEVTELSIVLINKNIGGFDISMANIIVLNKSDKYMEIFQSSKKTFRIFFDRLVAHKLFLRVVSFYDFGQSGGQVFHDKVEVHFLNKVRGTSSSSL